MKIIQSSDIYKVFDIFKQKLSSCLGGSEAIEAIEAKKVTSTDLNFPAIKKRKSKF